MKTAIVILEEALNVCVTNEPINRKEGNEAQADSDVISVGKSSGPMQLPLAISTERSITDSS